MPDPPKVIQGVDRVSSRRAGAWPNLTAGSHEANRMSGWLRRVDTCGCRGPDMRQNVLLQVEADGAYQIAKQSHLERHEKSAQASAKTAKAKAASPA